MTRKSTTKQLQFKCPAVFKADPPPAVSYIIYMTRGQSKKFPKKFPKNFVFHSF